MPWTPPSPADNDWRGEVKISYILIGFITYRMISVSRRARGGTSGRSGSGRFGGLMLYRLKTLIEHCLLVIISTLLAVMVVLMLWQVFTRYFLATPALFTEESLRFIMIWTGLLGTAYCFGTRQHLALELLPSMAPPPVRRALGVFNGLVTIGFAVATMFFGGWKASVSAMQQLSPIMQIPIGYVYLVLPIAAVLIVILIGIEIVGLITGQHETPSDAQETM